MRQDARAPFTAALERSRAAAYAPGEYVGQESFLRAGEIRTLADRAAVGAGVTVLDLCCGVAGPGRMITAETGCRYLGVDCSADALRIARELSAGLPCRFAEALIPPLPAGRFDVVMLLEAMLAIEDKTLLIAEVARRLEVGGRFALTVEEGRPLTRRERALMPDPETVQLIELSELTAMLEAAGLVVTWQQDWTAAHHETATALLTAYRAESEWIARVIGPRATRELVAAHELWSEWLGTGRVRKLALVAEKRRSRQVRFAPGEPAGSRARTHWRNQWR